MSKISSTLYRAVLRRAWQITRHQKMMWILGLFSAFIATGGALEILSRNLDWAFNPVPWSFNYYFVAGGHWNTSLVIWGLVLFLLVFGLIAAFIFVIIKSFATLIKTVDVYKAGAKIDLAKVWHKTQNKFWPVLSEVALFKVLEYLFILLSLAPLWGFVSGYWSESWLWFYPVVFLIGVFGSLACAFLVVFSAAYIVLNEETFGRSIKKSWHLFIRHWLVSLEMAVIIFAINLVSSLLVILVLALVSVPVVVVFLFAYYITAPILASVAIFLGILLGSILILLMAGFLGTFHTVAWTLLFKEMAEGKAVSKLVRITNKIFNRS